MAPHLLFLYPCLIITFLVILSTSPAASQGRDDDRNPVQMAPGIYVFGDSTVDGGNAYGGKPSKFGRTIDQFTASLLGLPHALPYVLLRAELNATVITGINYAMAGTGILPESGLSYYRNHTTYWDFDQQIGLFNLTMTEYLSKLMNPEQMWDHLAKSIFFVSFGINDFIANFLPPSNATLSHSSPELFSTLLLEALAVRLKILHGLGARKMVINNIWPLGCSPKFSNSSVCCNEAINLKVLPYSMGLPQLLNGLKSILIGASFSVSDNFAFLAYLKQTPTSGITNTKDACNKRCGAEVDHYLYADDMHLTQAASQVFSLACFSGTLCFPNVLGLVDVGAP